MVTRACDDVEALVSSMPSMAPASRTTASVMAAQDYRGRVVFPTPDRKSG